MHFPNTIEFLEHFGLEPIEEDSNMGYRRYVRQSVDGVELDISFSAVAESFQVVLRLRHKELVSVSSERVRLIEIMKDRFGSGIRVVFDVQGGTSEAIVRIEPDFHCYWWTLRS